MRLLSPRGMLHTLRALAERPLRHRRHDELTRVHHAPPAAWWAGDDRWFPEDFAPRQGNRLTPLVDGQEAMRAMYEAMENARGSIYMTAWFLTPELRMIRPPDDPIDPCTGKGGPHAFLSLIARKADDVDVRILMWPGALLGKFSRRHVKATQQMLARSNPRVRVQLDAHEKFGHCHHQKSLIVDGRVAFVGGIDVTAFDVDRWDTREHAFRAGLNWHDVHWKIEGPCVADVTANFRQRWNASAPHDPVPDIGAHGTGAHATGAHDAGAHSHPPLPTSWGPRTRGDPEQEPAPQDGVAVQVQRTIPMGVYPFAPRGIYGIAHAYCHAIAHAERFIYLESQYLWSPEITDALCDAIRRGHQTGLRVAIVLPAHPNVGKADTDRHVEQLLKADAGRGTFRPYTLYTSCRDEQRRCYRYRPIYVHAKVGIVDDGWITAGSANLNGRGMATDSEINLSTTDAATARAVRLRLWSEHLGCSEDELRDADPVAILDGRWITAAKEQRRIVTGRDGLLTAAIYPYRLGDVEADFGPGEVECMLLDR